MRGKGGSMHLTDVEQGVMGSYAIIGAHLPIAMRRRAGRRNIKGTDQVAVCFFGDGTTNIGAFHEALNPWPRSGSCRSCSCAKTTSTWNTRRSRDGYARSKYPAADRASAYGLDSILIDGNDADVVYRTAQCCLWRALARAAARR